MNNRRRDYLKNAIAFLHKASNIVSAACDEEQDCLDNMPENLQESDRYDKMECAVDKLSDATDRIDEAISLVEESCE